MNRSLHKLKLMFGVKDHLGCLKKVIQGENSIVEPLPYWNNSNLSLDNNTVPFNDSSKIIMSYMFPPFFLTISSDSNPGTSETTTLNRLAGSQGWRFPLCNWKELDWLGFSKSLIKTYLTSAFHLYYVLIPSHF